nr:NUDIX domain-containing protein [Ktedonobacteraceae bacterium]
MVVISHYVATGYVYDRHADGFLLLLHKKLGKWLPPGGHLVEGEEPHKGVIRELFEETGVPGRIINLLDIPKVDTPSTAQLPSPFCILREKIASKEGEEHIHIDFVYVVEINPSEPLDLCSDEVSLAKWVSSEHIHLIDTYDNVKQVCRAISAISQGR